MLESVEQLVRKFFGSTGNSKDFVYNEASLQHELALFLRSQLPSGWRLYIERPASWFRPAAAGLVKKEIDLAIADASGDHVIAIELKCPRQGQHPEQMFKACQDLQFLEQLVAAGFAGGVFAIHVRDPLFYERGGRGGIYAHFRGGLPISGTVDKPTGARDLRATLQGSYVLTWTADAGGNRYWVQRVGPATPIVAASRMRRRDE